MSLSTEPFAADDQRLRAGLGWAAEALGHESACTPVAGDASFRRYFRLACGSQSWILMDAPPDQEGSGPFIDIAGRLRTAGLHAPEIIAADQDRGFLLLEDFGDGLLQRVLDTNNAELWFPRLFELLEHMATRVDATGLPPYDRELLLSELELFPAWYLEKHKGLRLSCEDWDRWEALCTRLIQSALEQRRVFTHRDFHSCNLLLAPDGFIGLIDFQDAVRGPLTYDFVSLIWDRYIHWPRSRLVAWMESFRLRVAPEIEPATWTRWCDFMGLQRNLKVVGIFARLHHRDGKDGYLEMIPAFWRYLRETLGRYEECAEFDAMLERLACAP